MLTKNMDEVNHERQALKEVRNAPGFVYLVSHITSESKDGWDKFISLPVEKKTSKASYDAQARYKVLKDLLDWISSEIELA